MKRRIVQLAARALLAAVLLALAAGGASYWRARQIREALFAAFTPIHLTNCTLQRFGSAGDGGYLMCGNLIARAESGYSYGINGEDAWGCDLTAATTIPVHQYDCFNTTAPACAAGPTMFHAECVGPERSTVGRLPFDTMANQIDKNRDTGKRLIVKMDVEGAEWQSLMSAPEHVLSAIDQMVVEFHEVEQPHFVDTATRLNEYFYVAHVHYNNYQCGRGFDPFPSRVFEVLLVNKRIAVADPWRAAPGASPLDAPNTLTRPDCQALPQGTELHRIVGWTRRHASAAIVRLRRALSDEPRPR